MKKLWNSIALIGADKLKDPNEIRQLSIHNRIAVIGALVLVSYIPVALYLGVMQMVINVSIGVSLAVFSIFLNKKGFFHLSRILFVVVATAFITFVMFLGGKDAGMQAAYVLVVALPLVLFRSSRWSALALLLVFFEFAWASWYVESNAPILDHLTPQALRISFYMSIASAMVLIYAVILYFKNTTAEHEATIMRKNDEITQKNKDITDSILYARRIQQAILPPEKLVKEYFPQSFIFFRPKDIVAGDFYWMEKLGDKVFFTAADCTGHGVPGAMVSVVCANALTKAVKEMKYEQPAKILDATVEIVHEQFSKSEEEVNDGMDLAFCMLDKKTNTLEFAGANNGIYLIRNGELHELKPDKQPVGRHHQRKPYTNHQMQLQPGDSIYLFSDGIADQFGGPKGKKFKYAQLKKILLENQSYAMPVQMHKLEEAFENWKGDLEQIDDVCVIGIRIE